MAPKLFYGFFVFTLIGTSLVNADCQIKIPDDVENEKTPVIAVKKGTRYDLFQATSEVTTFPEGTELMLACTGLENYFKNGEESVSVVCKNNQFGDDQGFGLDQFTCVKTPTAELIKTKERCSLDDHFVYNVVYRISKDKFSSPVYDICFNGYSERGTYSHNILNGASVNYRVPEKETDITVTLAKGFTTKDVNNLFKFENQKKRFQGYTIDGKPLVDEKNFLMPAQYAPDTSMITPADKLSTYDYANMAPQYQPVYDGNVWRVENITRDFAAKRKAEFEIYTGGYEQLRAQHNGKKEYVFLGDKIRYHGVPQYIFKFVIDKKNDAGIVFLTLNNPHVQNVKEVEFCKNVCDKANVVDPDLKDPTKGYTFCCTWNDVKDYIRALPQDIKVGKLLEFN
uniref:DNA/RNA non-specific endonuclease/pyrophosphatase/phosphodiesterase domain-containing protein n=1 Tax=Glossina brevipalpis TaxID=37001 RepID=A0A1A9X2H3_9MUSC